MSNAQIVVVEPSPFRRNETYVLGPYSMTRALFAALWATSRHPYSAVWVTSARSHVLLGDKLLWPRADGDSP